MYKKVLKIKLNNKTIKTKWLKSQYLKCFVAPAPGIEPGTK